MGAVRVDLKTLDNQSFDVVIVGAGINGCSAAQVLSAAGYDVLLLDKNDFASGSSSRSSGLLHCGLRYLEPNPTIWEFARRPDKLIIALKMARQAMTGRSDFVRSKPDQAKPFTFFFPVYKDAHFKWWQIDMALRVLDRIGGTSDVPLNHNTIPGKEIERHALLKNLGCHKNLVGVSSFREYRFDWPERIAIDMALDARDFGATIRNYTCVERLERLPGEGWACHLRDSITGEIGSVSGRIVLNTAGIWIDDLISASDGKRELLINGTKGSHIAVSLGPELAEFGIATINRAGFPFYAIPWRGMHYIGPTETPFTGVKDDIAATEDEITFLLDEANFLLPGLELKRHDILFSWAGVRPLGADPRFPEGKRSRELHDLADHGMPDVFAMTAGPIMTHRSAGQEFAATVRSRLKPPRKSVTPEHRARSYPDDQSSPKLLQGHPEIRQSHVAYAAEHELPHSLVDIMFRRVGAGWTPTLGVEGAESAATIAGNILGWNSERRDHEVDEYLRVLRTTYGWSSQQGSSS